MDIEKQRKNFKDHIATFTDYGNIKILDFKKPDSSHYRIRFLFEEDYYRLHISGDLGELIATNCYNMTYEGFTDFVNNTGYFKEKIDCHSRSIVAYDEDKARIDLKAYIDDNNLLETIQMHSYYEMDDNTDCFIDDVLEDFDSDRGVSDKGRELFTEILPYDYEILDNLGKYDTGILDLYMLAFKLAQKQLNKQTPDLVLEREDLINYNGDDSVIYVDKSIFDDYVSNSYIDIQFDDTDDIFSFVMVDETNDYIKMERMD